MPIDPEPPVWFEPFQQAYKAEFGFTLIYTDANGQPLTDAGDPTDCDCQSRSNARRLEAADQTLYWGETIINLCCDNGYAMWAVPVMMNDAMQGSLLVQGIELEKQEQEAQANMQRAAEALLDWVIRDNRISSSRVELSRQRAETEKARFYALEQTKHFASDDLRSLYLREEPDLLMAIKQGDTKEARGILNRILVSIYSVGGPRMDLLKSCVLELVVMMSRAAVEAGADPSTILGTNFRLLSELSTIDDEEDLAQWVRLMLDSLIEAIRTHDTYPHSLLLTKALAYMHDHLGENLRRDEVARHAGVSPGHLASVMTQRMGRSFTELLLQMRVDHAKDLLRTTDLSLTSIALECGFYDQSHLNKVFRKAVGKSPGAFRKKA